MRPIAEPLTNQSGKVSRFRDDGEEHRDHAPSFANAASHLRRRADLDLELEDARVKAPEEPARTPGFLADEPAEGVATPRPKMPLSCIPRRAMADKEMLSLPLDHRAGFLLAHLDGATNIRTLIDVCGMPNDELITLVEQLVALRVIKLT
ncbi:MAG TPA: hypothetical protein VM925_00230 [Labilithrix sp.]|nr:hypothetical protein [Labilithrix sp.]